MCFDVNINANFRSCICASVILLSVANMFIMPAALLLKVPLTISDVLFRNVIPVLIGNAIAGSLVVAGSYSFQFGKLGKKKREEFRARLKAYEARKKAEKANA